MRIKNVFPLLAVLSGFFALSAWVSPMPLLLERLSKKTAVWRALEIDGVRTVDDGSEDGKRREDFHLTLARPGKKSLSVVQSGNGKARKLVKLSEAEERFLDLLLLSSDKEKLFKRLHRWGVENTPVSPGRLDHEICVIIGAREEQDTKSQFWLYKTYDLPARLLYTETEKDVAHRFEIRMEKWDDPVAGELFPARVRFLRDGRLTAKWELIFVEKAAKP